ncbi:MAG: MBL fold metallo-hydrolase, partial [Ktedonobacterales bacterium]|nr:MBL fold metallo-hydrolase [Ktedonobacterales bacterium]
MQVVFLGGASGIGASCLAIHVGDQWIVIDAGVRIGGTSDPLPDLAFLHDKSVAAIYITHAHADHIGALPLLHASFPATPIYATRATCLLMEVMLADALTIMARRAVEELEVPLYTPAQVTATLAALRPMPVGTSFAVAGIPDLHITATLAGHIAGAVCLSLAAPDGRLVVSGDISLTAQRTVPGASIPPLSHPDLLILESTYGRSTLHANRPAEEVRLAERVATIIAGGGHCLIPAFALGRAQEITLILLALQGAKQIPRFPIYTDGLVRRVTAAYTHLPEVLNPRLANALRRGRHPFAASNLEAVRDLAHREAILRGPPACIIASSGMLT